MVTELKAALTYQETFIPSQWQPIAILQNLIQAGIFANYLLYEKAGEIRIAGNELATVCVSRDSVQLAGLGQLHSEPAVDPFKQVGELLRSLPIENWTAYGYIAFDVAGFYSAYAKTIQQPLLYFLVPEIELRITTEGIHIRTVHSLGQIREQLATDREPCDYTPIPLTEDSTDCQNYGDRIKTLIAAIQTDELHKAILSRSRKLSGNLDVLGTYTVGAEANNSARSYCFKIGAVSAIGFSPEILMEVDEQGTVVTNPLAATRPRGECSKEDEQLSAELFTDAKEVKEHALSIWLAQQELTTFCLPETVRIINFMEVKQYRCVQHLSSRVSGQLSPGNTLWDALKVLFPGVTVTGIDKQQALKWIDRLEDQPRGIYAGGIGWVDSNGAADLAIAIRSVYQYGDQIYLNAGAGIVAESIPQKEYIESVNKMNTMMTNLVLQA